MTMTAGQRYKLAMKGDMKMLREFFSGVPIDNLRARYGCSEKRIRQLAKDYREGKFDIFEVRDQKKIAMSMMTHKEQVDILQMKIKNFSINYWKIILILKPIPCLMKSINQFTVCYIF